MRGTLCLSSPRFPAGVGAIVLWRLVDGGDGMWLSCVDARPTSLQELRAAMEKAETTLDVSLNAPMMIGLVRRFLLPGQACAAVVVPDHPDLLGSADLTCPLLAPLEAR